LTCITVYIAEDHELTRQGLRYAFIDDPSVQVVGEQGDGNKVVEQVCALKPNVVLMDIVLDGLDGIEATRMIKSKFPMVRVVMLTSHDSDDRIFSAFAAGADAYCLKNISGEMLLKAVYSVHEGVGWLDPGIAKRVLTASVQSSASGAYLGSLANTGAAGTSGTSGTVGNPGTPGAPGTLGIPGAGASGTLISQSNLSSSHSANRNATSAFPLSERELAVLRLVVNGLSNQEIGDQLFLSPETIKSHLRKIFDKLLVADRTQAAVKAVREGLI
jgi:two-component system, NarL family, response regulator LiaR